MKREELDHLLDDYVDGRLGGELEEELERRLARMPEGREEIERRRALVEELRALPGEIEPERDLWGDVEAAITMECGGHLATSSVDGRSGLGSSGSGVWFLAASITLAVAGVAFFSGWLSGRGALPRTPTVATLAAEDGASTLPVARDETAVVGSRHALSHAGEDLLSATGELRVALDRRRQALPEETLALVDSNLRIVEAAIAEIHAALSGDPENPELNQVLLRYYQRELEMLEQVSKAAAKL